MKFATIIFFLLLSFAATAQQSELILLAPDKTFVAGDTVRMDIAANEMHTITAYQFCIEFDLGALTFLSIDSTGSALGLNENDFGWWTLDEGKIPTVFTNPWGVTVPDGSHMFSIVFIAQVDGSLSQFAGLQTTPDGGFSLLPAAWYWTGLPFPNSNQQIPLTLTFYDVATSTSSPVSATTIQAIPNPCPLYTTIAFDATGETDFQMVVTDMQGRHIKTKSGVTSPGTNELPITLPASGMYIVAIKTKCATFVERVLAQ